jgi:hypothetical protein
MKYAVDMYSGVMIYMPSFVKVGSGIQNLIRERNTQAASRSHKPIFLRRKVD